MLLRAAERCDPVQADHSLFYTMKGAQVEKK